MVDFPEALKIVNHKVAPFCLRRADLSACVRPARQVMLLAFVADIGIRKKKNV